MGRTAPCAAWRPSRTSWRTCGTKAGMATCAPPHLSRIGQLLLQTRSTNELLTMRFVCLPQGLPQVVWTRGHSQSLRRGVQVWPRILITMWSRREQVRHRLHHHPHRGTIDIPEIPASRTQSNSTVATPQQEHVAGGIPTAVVSRDDITIASSTDRRQAGRGAVRHQALAGDSCSCTCSCMHSLALVLVAWTHRLNHACTDIARLVASRRKLRRHVAS
mmetsp:Transcript_22989/g.62378  ORF Transcript_22989/g.62378 Transcript_22989/m.62378 type:complete len:218 (-) Transcript_22989:163-816(-)